MLENCNMPYAKDMLLLHVPVSTKRPWIQYVNSPICDCSELNNAAARASDTPTEMEIRSQPQRGMWGRSASMLSELHQSHRSFILIILLFENYNMPYAKGRVVTPHPYQQNCRGFKGMIPRVTQLPVLPKLPHKTRPHATNEPPKTSLTVFFRLCQKDPFARIQMYADLPTFYTWNSAESMEAVGDGTISPSAELPSLPIWREISRFFYVIMKISRPPGLE